MGTDEPRSSAAHSLVSSTTVNVAWSWRQWMNVERLIYPTCRLYRDCMVSFWFEDLQHFIQLFPFRCNPKHFEAFACALSDGTVTTTIHQGTVRSGGNGWLQLMNFSKWVVKSPGEADVEHRWQTQTFAIHKGEAGSIVLWVDITFSSGKLPPRCMQCRGLQVFGPYPR